MRLRNAEELATVLAALRMWQRCPSHPADLNMIATNGDQLMPLTDAEIDELCERLNG